MNARSQFDKSRKWRKLPSPLLSFLAERLDSPDAVAEFMRVAEQSGIYKSLFKKLQGESIEGTDLVWMLTPMLTSYANGLGERGFIAEAKSVLELAIRLSPRHVPAWESMAITEANLGNYEASIAWAQRVLASEPDPNSDDRLERAAAEARTAEGEQWAAQAFGDPSFAGLWQRTQEEMRQLIEVCNKLANE